MEINEAADIWYHNKTSKNMEKAIEACDNYCYHIAIQKAKQLKREYLTDDLFQQGRIGVMVALERYNGKGTFRFYMGKCVVDYMQRFVRKNYLINVSLDAPSEDAEFDLYHVFPDTCLNIDKTIFAKEIISIIRDYFKNDSDYRKDILEQCIIIDDYRGKEIAEKYGVSKQAVCQAKEEMKEKIRALLRRKHVSLD